MPPGLRSSIDRSIHKQIMRLYQIKTKTRASRLLKRWKMGWRREENVNNKDEVEKKRKERQTR